MTQPTDDSDPRRAPSTGPWHRLRVARIEQETRDARSLILEIPAALAETFRYRAGQFLSFRVEVGGERLVRCYSLSSAPESNSEHQVTVKRVADGRVSNWMHDGLQEGDWLEVMRPAGLFCLRSGDAPLSLFAAGSGITPILSLVKSALATSGRRVRLLYANRDQASIIFRQEFEELASHHPERFELTHRLDDEVGFVDAAAVRAALPASSDECAALHHYVCGPAPFMAIVEATLRDCGATDEQIFIERFELPEAPLADAAVAPPREVEVQEGDPETLVVHLDGQMAEARIEPGRTVLELARSAGLDPPAACEEGYCGCCMAQVRAGSVQMKSNEVLDERDLADGYVLTCQSIPTSRKVEVEYPDA